MFYAAKEFVEKRARRGGRAEGWPEGYREGWKVGWREGYREGRQEERERIIREVKAQGIPVPPELARILAGDAG